MASSTEEDYLKAILHLEEQHGTATVGGIASALGLTSGTVTTMMRHLSAKEWIDYVPRKGIHLSARGRLAALRVVRRHRLIELFLVEIMKLDWSVVHEEAEVLEHVVSDRLLERIDDMLGHPTHDPHGDPIPDAQGNICLDDAVALSDVEDGSYRVIRVSDDNPSVLEWLDEHQVTIGGHFEVSSRNRVAGLLDLQSEAKSSLPISVELAKQVFVERI